MNGYDEACIRGGGPKQFFLRRGTHARDVGDIDQRQWSTPDKVLHARLTPDITREKRHKPMRDRIVTPCPFRHDDEDVGLPCMPPGRRGAVLSCRPIHAISGPQQLRPTTPTAAMHAARIPAAIVVPLAPAPANSRNPRAAGATRSVTGPARRPVQASSPHRPSRANPEQPGVEAPTMRSWAILPIGDFRQPQHGAPNQRRQDRQFVSVATEWRSAGDSGVSGSARGRRVDHLSQ